MSNFIRFSNHTLSDHEIENHLTPQLKFADFQNCDHIGDQTLKSLTKIPALEFLRWISNPSSTSNGHLHFAAQTSLKKLNVSGCQSFIDSACKMHLKSPNLLSLDVSFCPLTDEAFDSITAPLTFLNLQGCTGITDRTLQSLSKLPNLKHLYLAFNEKITKAGLSALKRLQLHTLKIYGLDL